MAGSEKQIPGKTSWSSQPFFQSFSDLMLRDRISMLFTSNSMLGASISMFGTSMSMLRASISMLEGKFPA
jgi:hypothetical protein